MTPPRGDYSTPQLDYLLQLPISKPLGLGAVPRHEGVARSLHDSPEPLRFSLNVIAEVWFIASDLGRQRRI